MQLAIQQAAEAELANEVPVGAVLVKDGKVIAVGRNRTLETGDPTAHAEIISLREAAKIIGTHRLDGLELFVTLEPCPMCTGAVFHSRLSRLVYGATDPKTGSAGSVTNLFNIRQLNHHTTLTAGVLAESCGSQLQAFFQKIRRDKTRTRVRLREDAVRSNEKDFAEFKEFLTDSHYFVSSEGWRIHYIDSGGAPESKVILCLHEFPFWSYQFKRLLPLLTKRGYRVVMPDLIGCGLSDKPKRSRWHSPQNHATALHQLLSSLAVSHVQSIALGTSGEVIKFLMNISNIKIEEIIYFDSQKNLIIESINKNNALGRDFMDPMVWSHVGVKYIENLLSDDVKALLVPFPDKGHAGIIKYLTGMGRDSFCRSLVFSESDINTLFKNLNSSFYE